MTSNSEVVEPIGLGAAYATDVSSVLVVEDDETIGSVLASSLSGQGMTCLASDRPGRAESGGADQFRPGAFRSWIAGSGRHPVCRRLRAARPFTVLVMLTARTKRWTSSSGLESRRGRLPDQTGRSGTLARVRAHLRARAPDPGHPTHLGGDLMIDPASRRCPSRAMNWHCGPRSSTVLPGSRHPGWR